MQTTEVPYKYQDTTMLGMVAIDNSVEQNGIGILIAPDWSGRNKNLENVTKSYASLGYTCFLADLYGEGKTVNGLQQRFHASLPFFENREDLQARILSAVDTFTSMTSLPRQRVIALGYCFGGMAVLDLARMGVAVAGVVSIHGLLVPPSNIPKPIVKTKVLVLHGHADRMVTERDVRQFKKEMTRANSDWQMQVYGTAMHAFTNPGSANPDFGDVYCPVATARSQQAIKRFIAEITLLGVVPS